MINILFVCLGNICRSPMAEAILRKQIRIAGLEEVISVDSAGTANWHEGKVPHQGTRSKLDHYDISYEGMTARQILQADFEQYDYIITMDDQNMTDIAATFTIPDQVHVTKLMDFVKEPKEVNVPDPYYTGNFDYTYELVSEATENLLSFITVQHHIHEGE